MKPTNNELKSVEEWKFTSDNVEKLRREIISQLIADQNAHVGTPYYHVLMFERAMLKAYRAGMTKAAEVVTNPIENGPRVFSGELCREQYKAIIQVRDKKEL